MDIKPLKVLEGIINPTVKECVEIACSRTGIRTPTVWATAVSDLPQCAVSALGGAGLGFAASDSLAEFYSISQIFGIVTHELGHIHYGDIHAWTDVRHPPASAVMHENEFRADRFAALNGMGQELHDALSKLVRVFGPQPASYSHPALGERIRRLRAWLDSRTVKVLGVAA